MSTTSSTLASFEVVLEQWKNECRRYAKATTVTSDGDPLSTLLFFTEDGSTVAQAIDPVICNNDFLKHILFTAYLPEVAAQLRPLFIGWLSAVWKTNPPESVGSETWHAEVEAWRAEHGTLAGHRWTTEALALCASDGRTFAWAEASIRRHPRKPPTFGPWRGELMPLQEQTGRIPEGMQAALEAASAAREGQSA
jgi:hypothetical protein